MKEGLCDLHAVSVCVSPSCCVEFHENLWMGSGYKKKLRGFSQQANYTDRATAACRRS
jgi:hypothetical protein